MGAWIEIAQKRAWLFGLMSLPSWERGLKSIQGAATGHMRNVAPLVGAWIEMDPD